MSHTVTAEFDTRRDADTAIEHLVQEHGIDRSAVTASPASQDNSVGTKPAGGDLVDGAEKTETEGDPALAGRLSVSVKVDQSLVPKVQSTFETMGGTVSVS